MKNILIVVLASSVFGCGVDVAENRTGTIVGPTAPTSRNGAVDPAGAGHVTAIEGAPIGEEQSGFSKIPFAPVVLSSPVRIADESGVVHNGLALVSEDLAGQVAFVLKDAIAIVSSARVAPGTMDERLLLARETISRRIAEGDSQVVAVVFSDSSVVGMSVRAKTVEDKKPNARGYFPYAAFLYTTGLGSTARSANYVCSAGIGTHGALLPQSTCQTTVSLAKLWIVGSPLAIFTKALSFGDPAFYMAPNNTPNSDTFFLRSVQFPPCAGYAFLDGYIDCFLFGI